MDNSPQCWRECENEEFKKEIDRERKKIFKKIDEGAENFNRIRRLMYGGDIKEIHSNLQICSENLASCHEELLRLLGRHCKECKYRDFELGQIKI
ncbi:MAG: hypothetical protein HN472_12280 [Nitrospina sp.]|jgi:hypothetical protein|nr:hypothetical protein [Nitrospina sp.]MBT3875933.1 hypothetical protein [Nitrospina sp.]MBT4046932.1 hypothetical protein [Nitrospina sp.]MBT4557348.1 hypothetical protein [Nitrospina sp.]MBT5347620.1 hypothetical protein [Nitrospina sp.]